MLSEIVKRALVRTVAILTALRNYHVNLLAKIEALMIEDAKTEPAA
jgi:hypothetical protein